MWNSSALTGSNFSPFFSWTFSFAALIAMYQSTISCKDYDNNEASKSMAITVVNNKREIPYLLKWALRRLFNFSRHKCSAYLRAALIGGPHLFKHCTRQIYFFYIFIQRYTLYLLIFLWTDTKLIVNLELITREIHMVKKTREFHDNKSENRGEIIGGVSLIWVNTVTQFCLKKIGKEIGHLGLSTSPNRLWKPSKSITLQVHRCKYDLFEATTTWLLNSG